MNARQSKQLRKKARAEAREFVPDLARTIAAQYVPTVRQQGWKTRLMVAWQVLRPW